MKWRLIICIGLIAACPKVAFGHGLDCNVPAIGFDEPLTHNFSVRDENGSGSLWTGLAGCNAATNMAGGDGEVACIRGQQGTEVHSSLESLDAFIGCKSSVILEYRVGFQNDAGQASLALEVFPDGAASWVSVLNWQESHGAGGSGELVSIDLSQFSGRGFSPFKVRWRFQSPPGTEAAMVQLDDVRLTCTNGPSADLDITLTGDRGPFPAGAVRRYQLTAINLGASSAENTLLSVQLPASATLLRSSLAMESSVAGRVITYSLGTLEEGFVSLVSADILFGDSNTEPVVVHFESPTCDIRTNNNSRELTVTVDASSTARTKLARYSGRVRSLHKLFGRAARAKQCPVSGSNLNEMRAALLRLPKSRIKPVVSLLAGPDAADINASFARLNKLANERRLASRSCLAQLRVARKHSANLLKALLFISGSTQS